MIERDLAERLELACTAAPDHADLVVWLLEQLEAAERK